MIDNYDSALEQMQAHGLVVVSIETTGRIIRVDCEDRPGKKHGWYIAHEFKTDDGRTFVVGSYGDWRIDDKGHLITIKSSALTVEERAQLKQQRDAQRRAADAERRQVADDAARRAVRIWSGLPEEGASDYLQRKQVSAWGVRFSRGSIIVPLRNERDELVGLQFISGDGTKKFLTGTAKRGAWHWVGGIPTDEGPIAVAEGYATAATVHQAMTWPVAVAFDAGNLQPVVDAIRRRFPRRRIVICGDDDHATDGNPGRTKATALAERISGVLAMPTFQDKPGKSDWNDLQVAEGLQVVRTQLEGAISAFEAQVQRVAPIDFTLRVLLDNFTVVHGTNMVWDGLRGRLMPVGNLSHSAGRGLVKHWLDHAERRMVYEEDVVFDPGGTEIGRPRVNLYTGMEMRPDPAARCDRLIEHLYTLCGERDRLFDWILKWAALPLQRPGLKMHSAVVMYGSEGTGKNIFWETLLSIYGRYGVMIGQEEIESQFNGWLSARLFAVADEVVSRQELRHLKGRLKKLVTGNRVMINEKNQPVREERNAMNLVFLSNEDEPLRLDRGDRRYCAVRCDEVMPTDYFAKIGAEIENNGAEALYHYLLEYNVEDFTPYTRPYDTDERDALMQAGMPPALRFWHDWRDDQLPLPYCACRCQDLYQAFRAWSVMTGERFIPNDTVFGTSLRPFEGKWFKKDRPRIIEGQDHKRPKCYVILDKEDNTKLADQIEQFRAAMDDYTAQQRKVKL